MNKYLVRHSNLHFGGRVGSTWSRLSVNFYEMPNVLDKILPLPEGDIFEDGIDNKYRVWIGELKNKWPAKACRIFIVCFAT